MSSRALRRLQKQRLEELEHTSDEDDQELFAPTPQRKAQNAFALLNDDDNEEPEESEEQEEEQVKEEQVKPVEHPKKKKNKKKRKNVQTVDVPDMTMQELDKVLQEVAGRSGADGDEFAADHDNRNLEERKQLLHVQHRFLDAEAEMKRMFGSRVVNTERRATGRVLKKSKLATPKVDWPPYTRQGLSMQLVETKDGIAYFAFRHNEAYQDIQLQFLNAVATHDPNSLVHLMSRHAYHVDTLLQVSEIAKHSGDWTVAGDCIERALYAFERAFHPQFTFGGGNVRLSYKQAENRPFFLAIFRHIQFLTRRGCWRTAFEFNKLLFCFDPEVDPLGALLSVDYYALSAKDYTYVLRMLKEWKTDGDIYPVDIASMPNFAYSGAYAQFKLTAEKQGGEQGTKGESSKMLQDAITKHPLVAARILEKIGDSEPVADGNNWFFVQTMPDSYLDLLQWLFVERVAELWKEPEANIRSTIQKNMRVGATAHKQLECAQKDDIPLSVSRHTIMSDIQSVLSYLPPSITSASYHMHDPLPPPDSETAYDINDRIRARGNGRVGRAAETPGGLLAMMQQFLRGPEGRQVPEETAVQIRQLMQELNERQDRIPGAFPENEEDNDDYDEETSADLDEILNAVSEEDLEIQRALAESYEQHDQ
ncbi:Transcription factor 25 [Apophysomyces sp. BC1021]|nr:Transcription factor 25 [Apophysomyces sp. BC1021]